MAGYYWYGSKRKGPGQPPKLVENLLAECDSTGKFADRSLTETELENEPSVDQQSFAETDHRRYSLREKVRPPHQLRSTAWVELF